VDSKCTGWFNVAIDAGYGNMPSFLEANYIANLPGNMERRWMNYQGYENLDKVDRGEYDCGPTVSHA
jgi:hypothetical protein